MNEEQKQKVAVFRFGVIADFVTGAQPTRGERRRLLRDKCARKWEIPFSARTFIGISTIRDWIARYRAGGGDLQALYPAGRSDSGKPRSIDEETAAALVRVRQEMPEATVDSVIAAMYQRQLVAPGTRLAPTSVWRFLTAHGLMAPASAAAVDRRKFEAELPNDMWQSDVMHGPYVTVDGRQRKTYLIAFIDDHSRLIPHAAFYLSENLACFLDAFEQALLKRGLPRKLYVDNGSAYRSHQLEHTCASLAIALIHAKAYQPQGKGKIGSGKSTALRYVSQSLHPAKHLCLYVTATSGSILELYRQIVGALGLENRGNSKALILQTIRQQVVELCCAKKMNSTKTPSPPSIRAPAVCCEKPTTWPAAR